MRVSPKPPSTPWPDIRQNMTCREAVIARMAEDVADLINRAGEFGAAGIDDLIRLGWTEKQAWTHGPGLFRRAVESGKRKRAGTRHPQFRRVA